MVQQDVWRNERGVMLNILIHFVNQTQLNAGNKCYIRRKIFDTLRKICYYNSSCFGSCVLTKLYPKERNTPV